MKVLQTPLVHTAWPPQAVPGALEAPLVPLLPGAVVKASASPESLTYQQGRDVIYRDTGFSLSVSNGTESSFLTQKKS